MADDRGEREDSEHETRSVNLDTSDEEDDEDSGLEGEAAAVPPHLVPSASIASTAAAFPPPPTTGGSLLGKFRRTSWKNENSSTSTSGEDSMKVKLTSMRAAAGEKLQAMQQGFGTLVAKGPELPGAPAAARSSSSASPATAGTTPVTMEYFREYELSFTSSTLPFSLEAGPNERGSVVWRAPSSFVTHIPGSGAQVVALNGDFTAQHLGPEALLAAIAAAIAASTASDTTAAGAAASAGTVFTLRFREKGPAPAASSYGRAGSGGSSSGGGGELFKTRVKALASDLQSGGMSLFEGLSLEGIFGPSKDFDGATDGAIGNRSSSSVPVSRAVAGAVGVCDVIDYVTHSADALPFTLAQRPGGQDVIIVDVLEPAEDEGAPPLDTRLSPGATLLSINGHSVANRPLHEVLGVLETASAPITVSFRETPPIYRSQAAAELADRAAASPEPYIHVCTWFPLPIQSLHNGAGPSRARRLSSGSSSTSAAAASAAQQQQQQQVEYESVHEVGTRALRFLESLRAHGVDARMKSIQTVALPRGAPPGVSVYDGVMPDSSQRSITAALTSLSTLGSANTAAAAGLQQGVRLFFYFPAARTIRVRRAEPTPAVAPAVAPAAAETGAEASSEEAAADTQPAAAATDTAAAGTESAVAQEDGESLLSPAPRGSFGLAVVRDGSDGSWIIVKAIEGGACAAAGVSTTEPAILTHVNGLCVSPESFASFADRPQHSSSGGLFKGRVTWERAVLPIFEGIDECALTLV